MLAAIVFAVGRHPTESTKRTQSIISHPPVLGLQPFKRAGNQRIDTVLDISLLIQELNVDWYALPFVPHHVGRKVHLVRQTVLPAVRELLIKCIRDYAVGMIAYDRNMRQLLY